MCPGPTRSFSRRRAKCRACCCIPNVAPSGCAYRHCRSPRRCWKSFGEPLMSVSLILPGEDLPMSDPYEMRDALEHQVDLIIDGGYGGLEASTVVSLVDDQPEVVRVGCGDPEPFMA
ncbi:Sua5/YciO/YrdC/YwlC family protein [Stutzerimonas stutzeri]|uniref:Sua5/YciO/YrdC/YwlC family protein n=1 Tax=Stutzerimonas stutzeri TaxID=316 RepID=UPI003EDF3B66